MNKISQNDFQSILINNKSIFITIRNNSEINKTLELIKNDIVLQSEEISNFDYVCTVEEVQNNYIVFNDYSRLYFDNEAKKEYYKIKNIIVKHEIYKPYNNSKTIIYKIIQ